MSSAIELYRDAYDLDFRKGDWETAEEQYHKIIERFPHSDESEYARIHLDRIENLKSGSEDQPLLPVNAQPSGANVLGLINFFLILILLMFSGALTYFLWQQGRKQVYLENILQGRLNESRGEIKAAGRHYKKARAVLPLESLAYRHLAELYLAQENLTAAGEALELWRMALPGDPGAAAFQSRLAEANSRLEK